MAKYKRSSINLLKPQILTSRFEFKGEFIYESNRGARRRLASE